MSKSSLQAWLEDRDDTPQWRNVNLYRMALSMEITDPAQVANAIALVEAAQHLQEKYPLLAFDDIVNGLLAGAHPEATPYWWQRYYWHRFRFWIRRQRDWIQWWIRFQRVKWQRWRTARKER